jgi:hypothetical protein
MMERPLDDEVAAVLARARRWRMSFVGGGFDETYQLVTDLEATLRATVDDFPVA